MSIADEARTEAEKEALDDLIGSVKVLTAQDGTIITPGALREAILAAGYRMPEAAPSDTEISLLAYRLRRVAQRTPEQDSDYALFVDAADALSRTSQPVQVEVTDDMVERAHSHRWHQPTGKCSCGELLFRERDFIRHVLTAALGGGE